MFCYCASPQKMIHFDEQRRKIVLYSGADEANGQAILSVQLTGAMIA